MLRTLMTGKLHRVTTTPAEVDYIGSCAIDQSLMDAAGILPHEQIHLWNVNNSEREVAYTIEARRGPGNISVKGSAAPRARRRYFDSGGFWTIHGDRGPSPRALSRVRQPTQSNHRQS